MEQFLAGRTALVTGASRGIGRSIAVRFAAHGALVAINYASNEAAATETLEAVRAAGGEGFLLREVLGSFESAQRLDAAFEVEMRRRTGLGKLDILVNNAGVGTRAGLNDTTPAIMEKAIADNLTSAFFVTQVLAARMGEGGRVINLSSNAAKSGTPQYIAYSMCKAAINTFTVASAQELGPRGITVNCIQPGLIATDANADIRSNDVAHEMLKRIALRRQGLPEDIAGVAKSLVSPDMGFVSGQIIEVSGGAM